MDFEYIEIDYTAPEKKEVFEENIEIEPPFDLDTSKREEISRRRERRRKQKKKEKVWFELFGWVIYILIVIGATFLIVTYVGQRTKVSGPSMEATLYDGDNLIVDKISYRFKDPERFDIIVFPYQHVEDTFYIKRIIGLPGETVQIIDGFVYIDDEVLAEDIYGKELIDRTKYGIAEEPIVLGEDEYFVLGDNRNHSSDSRDPSVGVLTREQLIGRAWLRIWPLSDFEVF